MIKWNNMSDCPEGKDVLLKAEGGVMVVARRLFTSNFKNGVWGIRASEEDYIIRENFEPTGWAYPPPKEDTVYKPTLLDMRSAPKDGSTFLVLTHNNEILECVWDEKIDSFWNEGKKGEWVSRTLRCAERRLFCGDTPVGWLPYPEIIKPEDEEQS